MPPRLVGGCLPRTSWPPMRRYFAACLLVLLAIAPAVRAQSMARLAQESWTDNDLAETYDHPILEERGHFSDSTPNTGVFWWDSFGRVRINRAEPDSPLFGYRVLAVGLGTDSKLVDASEYELDLSLALKLGKIADWNVATTLGAGYSSTWPFKNTSGIYGIGHLTFDRAIDDRNSILLAVDYEGNGGLLPDIPLPGFAWIYREPKLNVMAGFPLSTMDWRPTQKWEFSARYAVPYSFDLDAEYRVMKNFGFYANAANFFQGFVKWDGDITNRQFEQMRRIEMGVRFIHGKWIDASVGIGYAFDQTISSGFDVRDIRGIGQLSNEPYVALVVRGVF